MYKVLIELNEKEMKTIYGGEIWKYIDNTWVRIDIK